MKVRFNHWYHAVLTTLLAMLGFSCSGSDSDDEEIVAMYGLITPHYYLGGTVTDQAGTPIEGIKMSLKQV